MDIMDVVSSDAQRRRDLFSWSVVESDCQDCTILHNLVLTLSVELCLEAASKSHKLGEPCCSWSGGDGCKECW